MAKKKLSKPKEETKPSRMFPSLHQQVSNAVSEEIPLTWFNGTGSEEDSTEQYSTNVMGKFKCINGGCPKVRWSSKKVAIRIRGYHQNGYNAVVFNQRCESCNMLGRFTLDDSSYVDRIAYRLKKWAGVLMEEQKYTNKEGPPHKRELCEGCKRGYCQQRYG